MKFPCRTLHAAELPKSLDLEEFKINEHIAMLEGSQEEAEEWAI